MIVMKILFQFFVKAAAIITLLVTTTLSVGCGPGFQQQSNWDRFVENRESASQGIIGGTEVETTDPVAASTFALYLKIPNQDKVIHFCTSSLVREQVLLTAAHCFVMVAEELKITVDELLPHVHVGFGTRIAQEYSDTRVKFVALKAAVVHPEYVNTAEALEGAQKGIANPDIALFSISEPAPSFAIQRPLLKDASTLQEGTALTLAGYGLVMAVPFPIPANALRKVEINVWKPNFNPVQFAYLTKDRKTACSGDSGGPAYLVGDDGQLTVVGVTSFGDQSCSQLGVYTSVPTLISWLEPEIAKLEQNLNSLDSKVAQSQEY